MCFEEEVEIEVMVLRGKMVLLFVELEIEVGLFVDVEFWVLESEGGLIKGMNLFRKLKLVVDCE